MASTPVLKTWGEKEFWGLSWDYDPQWLLNSEQKEIQAKLIEVCRTVIRPNAVSFKSVCLVVTVLYLLYALYNDLLSKEESLN